MRKKWQKLIWGYPNQIYIHFDSISASKMTKFKVTKINLRIISKPHAHLQTMTKAPVKFQKDRHKTVWGVTHTRYLLLEEVHNQGKPNTMSPRSKQGTIKSTLLHTCEPLLMDMREIWFSFQGDWGLHLGHFLTTFLTRRFKLFFNKIRKEF